MFVQFIRDYLSFKKGEIINTYEIEAKTLIALEYARPIAINKGKDKDS